MTPRRGLGRGLDALLQTPEEGVTSLPLDQLKPNKLQPRTHFDQEGLGELADSIRSQGIVQPIVVTPDEVADRYVIIAGERRFRAAGLAGLTEVPVVVRQVTDDQELLEMALVENLQRSDLNPIEEAEAYRSLQTRFRLSQEQIAVRVGKSRPTVTNSLRLLRFPDDVLAMLRDGRLTPGQARPLLRLDERGQSKAAALVVERRMNARQAESLVKRLLAPPAEPPRKDVHTVHAEEKLTRALQTKVEIQRRGAGGAVRLHFYSEGELQRLYELLVDAARGGASAE